jgi:hypothetical protein
MYIQVEKINLMKNKKHGDHKVLNKNLSYLDNVQVILPLLPCFLPVFANEFTARCHFTNGGHVKKVRDYNVRILKDKKPNPTLFFARN